MKLTIDLNNLEEIKIAIYMLETRLDLENKTKPLENDSEIAQREINETITSVSGSDSEVINVDKTGRTWNAEIDSNPAALTADGLWRAKRKPKDMSKAEWEKYRAEVIAALAAKSNIAVEEPEPDPLPKQPPVDLQSLFGAEPEEQISYQELKQKISEAMLNGDLDSEGLNEALKTCGSMTLKGLEPFAEQVQKLNGLLFNE